MTGANGPIMGSPTSLSSGTVDSTTFSSSYVVTATDVSNGSVYNGVTVSGYHIECNTPVTDNDFVSKVVEDKTVIDPCISITKFTEDIGPFKLGDTITYKFEIENCGIQDVINITLEDDNADSITGGSIAILSSGEKDSTTFEATYTVKNGDNGLLTNTATVSGFGINTNDPVSDTDSTNVVIESTQFIPCINMNKTTVVEGPFDVGDVIMYVFEISNCGTEDLVNISISDDLTLVNGSLPLLQVGATDSTTFTAQYTVTEDDLAGITNTATVSAQGFATGQTVNATDSDTSQVNPLENACISLEKTSLNAGPYEEGDTVDYLFTITNCGNSTITNIVVTDDLVTVSGNAITLAPNTSDTSTFYAKYTVTADDVEAGQVANIAHVNGLSDQGTAVTDMSTFVVTTKEKDDVCVELVKGTVNSTPVMVGDVIDYTFTVTNCGNVEVTNVSINDTLAAVNGGPITLMPNQIDNSTFTSSYTVTEAHLEAGQITNTATVFATGPNGVTTSATSSTTTTVVATPAPSVSIEKSATPAGPYQEGDVITYNFTVENTGDVDLTNITVTDSLVTVNGGAINLASSETSVGHFVGTYMVTSEDVDMGEVSNTAIVTAFSQNDEITDSDTHQALTAITPVPCLNLLKTCSPAGPYVLDQVITYNFEVTNCGNVDIEGVTITDDMLTMQAAPITLAAGATNSTTFTANYTVTQADIDAGVINNTATAIGPYNGSVVSASDSHTAATNDNSVLCLNIVKTADAVSYELGDTITYTYSLENCGNRPLTDVIVTDDLLNVTGSPISLAEGQTVASAFTANHIVTEEDVNTGTITNLATANGFAPNGVNVVGTDSETVTIVALKTPCITLSKSCDDLTPYREGDVIDYNFTLTNCGDVDLTNIVVTDSLTNVSGQLATLAVGESDSSSFTAQYMVTAADVAAGEVVNTASVTAESAQINTITTSDTATHTAQTEEVPVNCISLSKSILETGPFAVNDIINYVYTVENCGNIELIDVVVQDDSTVVTGGPINLAVGETDSTSFISSHTVTQADVDSGSITNIATAMANSSEGMTSDNDTFTATMVAANPCLEIVKTCLNENPYLLGEVVQYNYTVTNCGNVTATNVIVTDDKVAVNGNAITLAPNESSSAFTANYTVTQADVDEGSFTNTATVTGMVNGASVSDTDTHTANAKVADEPCVQILKSCTPNGPYQLNDLITYVYTVTNCGNVPLTGVMVTDDKEVVTGSAINLDVGSTDSTSFTASHTVVAGDVTSGEIINTATVTATFEGNTYTDTDTHTAVIEETCTSIPLTGSCSVVAETFNFERDALKSEVNVRAAGCGGFGNACLFNDAIVNPLKDVADNGNVINIAVPAHDEKSMLMLHLFGGELQYTGQPVVQGTTGNALVPSEISNLTAADGDIWQQVICMEGDGVEAGTVDVELPNLNADQPTSFIMYAWTEVTSDNCKLFKDALKTAALAQGNGDFNFANTCNALAFMSGRDVGGYIEATLEDTICIETICLSGNDPQCVDGAITTDTTDNLYSYLSKEEAVNNGGLAANYYPNAGANNVAFEINQNSQNFTDQTIYSAFEFDLEETENYDAYFTALCSINEDSTTGFCAYPLQFNCNLQATLSHTMENGASAVVTPIINNVADNTQAITISTTGTTAINITTPTDSVNEGETINCSLRFLVQPSGCGGSVSFPQMTATMTTL